MADRKAPPKTVYVVFADEDLDRMIDVCSSRAIADEWRRPVVEYDLVAVVSLHTPKPKAKRGKR